MFICIKTYKSFCLLHLGSGITSGSKGRFQCLRRYIFFQSYSIHLPIFFQPVFSFSVFPVPAGSFRVLAQSVSLNFPSSAGNFNCKQMLTVGFPGLLKPPNTVLGLGYQLMPQPYPQSRNTILSRAKFCRFSYPGKPPKQCFFQSSFLVQP